MASLQTCPTGPFVIAPSNGDSRIDVSLVLPTYNESKNIAAVIAQLAPVLDSVPNLQYEIIVVDDDSPDRTWEIALAQTERFPQVRVIRRQGERGLSTAVIRGWQIAQGRVLAVMDADLQHPPEVVANLSKEMQRGADHPFASDRGCFAVTVYRDAMKLFGEHERFPIASGHGAIPIEPPESLQWIIGVTKGLGDLYHAWPSHLSFRSGSSAQQTGDAQH